MSKKDLELKHPIDTLYHVTPVMFVTLLPIAMVKEGTEFISSESFLLNGKKVFVNLSQLRTSNFEMLLYFLGWGRAFVSFTVISLGAVLAFTMNFSEFLLLSKTSGLTLCKLNI